MGTDARGVVTGQPALVTTEPVRVITEPTSLPTNEDPTTVCGYCMVVPGELYVVYTNGNSNTTVGFGHSAE